MKILRILSIIILVCSIFSIMYFFTPYRFFHKDEMDKNFIISNDYSMGCSGSSLKNYYEDKVDLKMYIEEQRVIEKAYKENSFPIRKIQGLKICN